MSQVPERESPNSRFLAGQLPSSGSGAQLRTTALGSIITHGLFLLLLLWVVSRAPEVLLPSNETLPEITWIATPGPGGGGGGGGNKSPDPPKKAELKGPEKINVPVAPTPKPVAKETPPPPQLTIPAVTAAASVQDITGLLNSASVSVPSQGSGSGGGAGTGQGTGSGPGSGSGLGPGRGGGTGGGEYMAGTAGLTDPVPISEKKPEYTSAAMRAKVQGTVEVQAIVNPDGSVGRVQIVRSLDDRFGLDEEALKAVRLWRFRPGVKDGKPVPVLVVIELTFTLR